jgi:hypothetical protein
MRKLLFLLVLASGMLVAQPNNSNKQIIGKYLQLSKVPLGAKSDSILVRGSDKIVKTISRSVFLEGTSGGSSLPYKVYTGLITQLGEADPTVIVMQNTIGNIVWTRGGTGFYFGVGDNFFKTKRTFIIINSAYSGGVSAKVMPYRVDSSTVEFDVIAGDSISVDGFFNNSSFEIRVYPFSGTLTPFQLTPSIIAYHDGSGIGPTIGDTIYTDNSGETTYPSGNYILNPECSPFLITNDGVLSGVQLCL